MRILIIGGSVFVGRHFTEAALAAGHSLTHFNRGHKPHDSFPDVEHVVGDRTTDIERLHGTWDVVLDTCGYFPRDVLAAGHWLAPQVDHYMFVSSLSVYADGYTTPGIDESGRLLSADPEATEVTAENYGGLKALCEAAATEALPGRVLVIRPGLIVGPHDPTDRFTYWTERLARGGDILAPESRSDTVQFIDVRDLGEWMVRMAESGAAGVFNANGPADPLTMEEMLLAGFDGIGSDGNLVWVRGDWLKGQGVKPWTELPLWVPEAPGFSRFQCQKAISAGLMFRSPSESFRATHAWAGEALDPNRDRKAGMTPSREAELLDAWRTVAHSG